MDVRVTGLFHLRAPLSHIGESLSTIAYLSQEPILQPDGSLAEVFAYSGNAWRGQIRDLAAAYMLDRLGAPRLPLDAFALLFFGGGIGGAQELNVEKARAYRRAIPLLSLLGGGVGNQILPGKLRVSNAYPLCAEALPVLPPEHRDAAAAIPYRGLTFEKSFTRKDDAKDDRLNGYALLPGDPSPVALPSAEQGALLDDDATTADPSPTSPPSARRAKDGPADQMRFTTELVAPGTRLASQITALDVSEVELGCLVSALHRFQRAPHLGGQAARGHGLVDLSYDLVDLDTGVREPFVSISGDVIRLAPPAAQAKDAYDGFLDAYHRLLDERGGELKALLGVAS